jgi:phosphoribosyl-dephospho-CoA transferase
MREAGQTLSRPWRRHDLLHVAPDVWASLLAFRPPLADLPLLGEWADRGWPVIVRRRCEADDRHLVPVGVPLPPLAGKRRVALLIPPDGVLQRSLPPSLHATAKAADPGWRSTIDALVAVGARSGVEPAAFGSLLWQHLTGLAYLSPHSDLDVLWPIPANFDVHSLVCSIAEIQHDAPLRIDGEIIFPDGSAVNWRELWNVHQAPDRATVLAKTMESVRLLDVASLAYVAGHA